VSLVSKDAYFELVTRDVLQPDTDEDEVNVEKEEEGRKKRCKTESYSHNPNLLVVKKTKIK